METPTAPAPTPVTTPTDAPQPPNPAPPAPETPPAAPASTKKEPDAPAASEPSIAELLEKADITKMSDAQLADIESGNPDRIRAALGIKGDAAPVPVEAPKPPDAPTPPAEDPDKALKRISLKAVESPEERAAIAEAVQLVRDGKHKSIKDALAEVFKLAGQPQPVKPPTPGEPPQPATPTAPEVDPKVKEIEDKLTDLQAQRKAAREAYDYDKTDEIGEQIAELKLDLRDAKREADARAAQSKSNAERQAVWESAESESRGRALDKYGELMSDPESSFSDYLEVEISLAERKNDHILSQPDWPEKIADRVNEKYFNGSRAAQSTQQPPASQIPPAPPPGVRLPGSPVGSGAQTTALTATAALAELEKLPHDQRMAVLERAQIALEKQQR